MNKAELIDAIASYAKLPKALCKKMLEGFIDSVTKSLKKGKQVVLTNFGTFVVFHRKSRMGVNPATGKKMQIPAKKVPKFRAGKHLKKSVQ